MEVREMGLGDQFAVIAVQMVGNAIGAGGNFQFLVLEGEIIGDIGIGVGVGEGWRAAATYSVDV